MTTTPPRADPLASTAWLSAEERSLARRTEIADLDQRVMRMLAETSAMSDMLRGLLSEARA